MPAPNPSTTGSLDFNDRAPYGPEVVRPKDRAQQSAWIDLVIQLTCKQARTAAGLIVALRNRAALFVTLDAEVVAEIGGDAQVIERDLDKLKAIGLLGVHFRYHAPAMVVLMFGHLISQEQARATG